MLLHLILSWCVSALALWLVAQMIPGMELRGFGSAFIATAVIAIVDAIIGPVLRFISFPLTFLTLGLFLLVVNAILLKLAAALAPGFRIRGFLPAFFGSLVLTIVSWVLRRLLIG